MGRAVWSVAFLVATPRRASLGDGRDLLGRVISCVCDRRRVGTFASSWCLFVQFQIFRHRLQTRLSQPNPTANCRFVFDALHTLVWLASREQSDVADVELFSEAILAFVSVLLGSPYLMRENKPSQTA